MDGEGRRALIGPLFTEAVEFPPPPSKYPSTEISDTRSGPFPKLILPMFPVASERESSPTKREIEIRALGRFNRHPRIREPNSRKDSRRRPTCPVHLPLYLSALPSVRPFCSVLPGDNTDGSSPNSEQGRENNSKFRPLVDDLGIISFF